MILAPLLLVPSAGCQLWPFANNPTIRTSYVTPSKRIELVQAMAKKANADMQSQTTVTNELARQIQTEQDPLVREAIIKTAAKFQTPMAERIVIAALQDSDPYVRQTSCKLLGRRKAANAIAALEKTLRDDSEIDVRIAATKALGQLGSTSAIPALSVALHDSDPAMQFAGAQAMRQASGKNLGNDVAAWRQLAANFTKANAGSPSTVLPASGTESSVANAPDGSSTY